MRVKRYRRIAFGGVLNTNVFLEEKVYNTSDWTDRGGEEWKE